MENNEEQVYNKSKKVKKILGIISIIIFIIGLAIGIYYCITLSQQFGMGEILEADVSDAHKVVQLIYYTLLPLMVVVTAGVYIILMALPIIASLVVIGTIWFIYGYVVLYKKLDNKKRKILVVSTILILGGLVGGICINSKLDKVTVIENTVASIAYDYAPESGYTVYIEENDKLVPYFVITNNYNKQKCSLLLRKNVLGTGNFGYKVEEGGYFYDDGVSMNAEKYSESDVDEFLKTEFEKNFNESLVNLINETEVKSDYKNYGSKEGVDVCYRKFFILSTDETVKELNKAVNDNGIVTNYWAREHYYDSFYSYTYDGLENRELSDRKYGIRPAFTLPNDVKIQKIYNDEAQEEVYVLDI